MRERAHPRKIEINGAELHYVEQGEGDPVVFVHGGLGDFRTWGPQMKAFSHHYRVISYSRRAHYPNSWPAGQLTNSMMLHVTDLAELIKQLGLGRTYIVANSYGAYISLLLTLKHPEMVKAMVLAEPPVHPLLKRIPGGEVLYEEFILNAWEPAGQVFANDDLEGGMKLFIEGAVGKGKYDELPANVKEGMLKNAPALKMDTLTEVENHMPDFTCEDAGKIEAPTLLLRGELSPKMYYLINDELARCMPHAEQALIPNAAHVLHSQNPQAHNKVAMAFLAKH